MNKTQLLDEFLSFLFERYDEHGKESFFNIYDFIQYLTDKGFETKFGRIEFFLDKSLEELKTNNVIKDTDAGFQLSETEYEMLLNEHGYIPSDTIEDTWEPLHIENYEEVAEAGERAAKALHDENGFRKDYGDEADYTISEIRNFSKNLKQDNGQTFKIKLSEISKLLERVQKIIKKMTRLMEAVGPFMKLISQVIEKYNN